MTARPSRASSTGIPCSVAFAWSVATLRRFSDFVFPAEVCHMPRSARNQFCSSKLKRFATTFEDCFQWTSNGLIINRAKATFGRQHLSSVGSENLNELCITKYRDIGIVCGDYKLSSPLLYSKPFDDICVDEAVVQVIFGLVNNQGISAVKEDQHKNSGVSLPLTGQTFWRAIATASC